MKPTLLILTLIALTGCSSLAEIQQTGEIPQKTQNTVKAFKSVYCGSLGNINRLVIRAIHVVDPQWETICPERED